MENDNCLHFRKRINGTEYKVKVFFSDKTKDTFEDKIIRLIANRLLTSRNCITAEQAAI